MRRKNTYKREPSERSRQYAISGLIGWSITITVYAIVIIKYYLL